MPKASSVRTKGRSRPENIITASSRSDALFNHIATVRGWFLTAVRIALSFAIGLHFFLAVNRFDMKSRWLEHQHMGRGIGLFGDWVCAGRGEC